jgi:hypothetical protein
LDTLEEERRKLESEVVQGVGEPASSVTALTVMGSGRGQLREMDAGDTKWRPPLPFLGKHAKLTV